MILGINSATPRTEITLVKGDKTVYSKSWNSDCDEAEKILPALKVALNKLTSFPRACADSKPISKVFVIQGPGSFTGLRVGITIANTLAYAKNVPVTGCDTFDYFKYRIENKRRPKTAIILRAGGNKVAIKIPSDSKTHRLDADELQDFFTRKKSIKYIIGDIKKENRKNYPLPKSIKWLEESSLMTLAEVITQLEKKLENHKIIKPIYLSAPHITKGKKLHTRGA